MTSIDSFISKIQRDCHLLEADDIFIKGKGLTKELRYQWIDVPHSVVLSALKQSVDVNEYFEDEKRLDDQYNDIISKFTYDKNTRQAVVQNWNHDINQCITLLQFLCRKNRITKQNELDLVAYLRSSDIKNRLRGDVIFLAHQLEKISVNTDISVGKIYLLLASMHYYV